MVIKEFKDPNCSSHTWDIPWQQCWTIGPLPLHQGGAGQPFCPFEPCFGVRNPFWDPSRDTTFCPVLGLQALLLNHQSVFCMFFVRFLSQNLTDNYHLVKFSALRASFPITKYCCPILRTVGIFLRTFSITWLEEPQAWHRPLLGTILLPNHPSFFTVKVFLYIEKLLQTWFLWPCFVPKIALFRKIFWPFCPVLETPNVRPHLASLTGNRLKCSQFGIWFSVTYHSILCMLLIRLQGLRYKTHIQKHQLQGSPMYLFHLTLKTINSGQIISVC